MRAREFRLCTTQNNSDGFVIVVVLWMLAALGTLASIYVAYVLNTAVVFNANEDRVKAEALVWASLELTAYQLLGVKPPPPVFGAFEFRLGRKSVAVEFQSESGRIDLNSAPRELLAGLFVALGALPQDAEGYADRIVGWRTPSSESQAAESFKYRQARLSYGPRAGPFAHVAELGLVLGLPSSLVVRAAPFLTVYNGKAQINILAAAPEVIAGLPGMTPDRIQAVLRQRQEMPYNAPALLALLGSGQSYATVDQGRAVRVLVQISLEDGRRMNSEVVILIATEDREPYRVLTWRNKFDETSMYDFAQARP